jgi:hypothetical protein
MATEFVLKLLKKRLFSSPAAFGITLEKHAATVGGGKAAAVANREIDDYDDDYADDEQYETETAEIVESASQALPALSNDERGLLKRLREFASKSTLRPDCKVHALIDWLKKTLHSSNRWNDERVIIFTEYRATQKCTGQFSPRS